MSEFHVTAKGEQLSDALLLAIQLLREIELASNGLGFPDEGKWSAEANGAEVLVIVS